MKKIDEILENYPELDSSRTAELKEGLLGLFSDWLSLPTDEHIKVVAGKKALKYAYANEHQYDKIMQAIEEGAKFARDYRNEA